MKKTFKDVMTFIFENVVFCEEEMRNASTQERIQRFAGMRDAYLTIIQWFEMEEELKKYRKQHKE